MDEPRSIVSQILLVQAVLAPVICAVLSLYVRRKNIGGDYLVMWAIGFALIGVTIGAGAVATAPDTTSDILLGWTALTVSVSAATMFVFFGTLSLIGYSISITRSIVLTLVICSILQVIQYTDMFLLRLGMVGFTAVMMTVTAIIFFTRSLSIFYVLAGFVSLLRGSNSAVYIYMVHNASTPEVLPYFTSSTTVFVNLSMGLCLLLLTFDNAQKELKKANEAERAAKQANEDLYRENEAILRALDSSQERIVIEDPQGRVRYVNQVVADIWAQGQRDQVIGKSFDEAFPLLKNVRDLIIPKAQAALRAGEVWNDEFESLRPDGRRRRNVVRITPLPDQGILYTVEDVTEVYKREQREQQLKKQLIEAQRMESVGRLAGGVAHDFNNIIAAIRAFAALIGDAIAPEIKAHAFAKRIVDSCDRATELVRQILLFSRATQADLRPIPVADVIGEVYQYVKASMPANISLKVEMPRKHLNVNGNAGQLIQVFMNLVINARDAIGSSDGRVQIFSTETDPTFSDFDNFKPGLTMAKSERGDGVMVHQYVVGVPVPDQVYVCLTVRDSGCGMSGATMERMFEPFFTTKEKARGTGLGLPVVAAVITAHAGFIVVDSKEGFGSRVRVYLPVSTQTVASPKAVTHNMAELSGTERILLVDDEVDLADATSLLLSKFGYEVAPLNSGADALEIFREDPLAWDIVITDQVMPVMKGLELIGRLKAIRADIPIILCTGYSEEATEQTALAAGAMAFFNKPVRPEELALAIRKIRGPSASSTATSPEEKSAV